jgi:hypothetical protein
MDTRAGARPRAAIYRETHTLGPLFNFFLLALLVLYTVVTIGAIAKHKWGTAVWVGMVGLIILLFVANFWRLVFEITETHVAFGFGLFARRFERSSLTSCEPYDIKTSNYVGYFIIPGLDGTTAFRTRSGPGVKLTFEGARRPYVISVDEPAYVCKLLSRQD